MSFCCRVFDIIGSEMACNFRFVRDVVTIHKNSLLAHAELRKLLTKIVAIITEKTLNSMSEHPSVTRKFMFPPRRTKWNLERSYTALTTSQSKGITKSPGLNKRSITLSQEFRTVCSNWLPRHQEPINLRLLPIRPHVIKRVTLVKDRRSINIIKTVL